MCPQCGAVFHEGRWHWAPRPDDAHEELCQACHRINDRYAAGELTITGNFVVHHKDEILHLARHQEEQEKAEHPLHRIMGIEERDGVVVVRTTDIHLPRRIGEALRHAYRGELDCRYGEEAYFIRVKWTGTASVCSEPSKLMGINKKTLMDQLNGGWRHTGWSKRWSCGTAGCGQRRRIAARAA